MTQRRNYSRLRFGRASLIALAGFVAISFTSATGASTNPRDDSTTTTTTTLSPTVSTTTTTPTTSPLPPAGLPDSSEPSGLGPLGAYSLPGFHLTYVDDFASPASLAGWTAFQGATIGDPGGQFARSHVTVSGGLLRLNAWQDPAFGGVWVTGGVCQCSVNHVYGAYFVRSRLSGPGPTQVEMLMPQYGWPPEIDFNETRQSDSNTVATLHYSPSNLQVYRRLTIDLTQWHTWGVIWSPVGVTYTVDGRVWGIVSSAVLSPVTAMHLDITQQTWCASNFACPTQPQSTQVDWIAEYQPNANDSAVVGSFPGSSARITRSLSSQISGLAEALAHRGVHQITLVGLDTAASPSRAVPGLGRNRALAVMKELRTILNSLGDPGIHFVVEDEGSAAAPQLAPRLRSVLSNGDVYVWAT